MTVKQKYSNIYYNFNILSSEKIKTITQELSYPINTKRRKIFEIARELNTRIFEPYLQLDEKTKNVLSNLYFERKEFYNGAGILGSSVRKKLYNKYGDTNIFIIQQIAAYHKIKKVLHYYIQWAKVQKNPGSISFQNYLNNNNLNHWTWHNFAIGKRFTKDRNKKKFLEGILYGIADETLIEEVIKAPLMRHQREKVLKQYLTWTQTVSQNTSTSLHNYLTTHNLDGEQVERQSSESLNSWIWYNFILGKQHQKKLSEEKTLISITHKINSELKKQIYILKGKQLPN